MAGKGFLMTPEMKLATITGCIDDFIHYLEEVEEASKTSTQKYRSILHHTLSGLDVAFFDIDENLINSRLSVICKTKEWSDIYAATVCRVVNKLFFWARTYKPKSPYTFKVIHIINPLTGEILDSSPTKGRKSRKVENSVQNNINKPNVDAKKDINTDSPKMSVSGTSKNTSKISTDSKRETNVSSIPKNIEVRNNAIRDLIIQGNLSNSEIQDLNIYDFLHNRIIIQSINNRKLMRVIDILPAVRNNLYRYLATRQDNYDFLFMSMKPGQRITQDEIDTIFSEINQ